MCGHVGIAGNLQFKDEALIKRLLLFDFLRGEDGTGLAAVRSSGAVEMAKIGSHPLELFDMGKFKSVCNGYQSTAFIGHNRAATRGIKNSHNAHPYEFGRIVGAHNGTLDTACTRELEELLGEKFDVDSMAIFAAIDKFGIDETIPLLKGAWSLVWHDKDDKTINFIRNSERPMWRCFSEDCKTMIWASEWPMIDAAVKVVGNNTNAAVTKLWQHPEEKYRFMFNTVDTLYSYKLEELKKGGEKPMDGKVKELKGKAPTPVVHHHAGADPFNRGGTTSHSTTQQQRYQQAKSNSTTTSRSATAGNVVPIKEKLPKQVVTVFLPDTQGDPYGQFISPTEFNIMAHDGCSWCSKELEWGDEGVTIFKKDGLVLCPTCSGGKTAGGTRIHLPDLDLIG